jgi:tagatose-1,6-bisphosphate aldolase non-catalytic subunit AgaZ/GatZ|tara:strand:+ start:6193 stop:7365 length:1173 start_codon:yes stop_codon:yes gene_type:complete
MEMNNYLTEFIKSKKCTLLGVGPMSTNSIDVSVELANEYSIPIFLIASRRQIDADSFGGGYVNNWSTEEFSAYVQNLDDGNNIILSRDHGGPWQNTKEIEKHLSLKQAMESAKESYRADIESGFRKIHIDPSIDIHSKPTTDMVLERVFELYEYCISEAKRLKKEIIFEIGTEEQSGSTNTQEELDYTLRRMNEFCDKNNFIRPSFVVIQSGTRVMEMRNVGSFESPLRVKNELAAEIQVPLMIDICNKYGIMMKAHNTDYVSNESLQWHPRMGIHAINVAPEFGVEETKELVKVLSENGLNKILEKFLEISYNSKKWEKWMLKDTEATDLDRSIISGHYVFSNEEWVECRKEAEKKLQKKNIDLNRSLKKAVKFSILRYLVNLRVISAK